MEYLLDGSYDVARQMDLIVLEFGEYYGERVNRNNLSNNSTVSTITNVILSGRNSYNYYINNYISGIYIKIRGWNKVSVYGQR